MSNLVLAAVAGVGLVVLAGCGSNQSQAETPPGRATALTSEPAGARQASTSRSSDTRPVTVSAIRLDPAIATACNIKTPVAFFEFDSANVQEQATSALNSVAQCLSSGPLQGQRLAIVGYTDPRGTDEYNKQLGKSRAESVAEYLNTKGMDKAKINTESKGEDLSTATDEQGFALERRVEIRIAP